MRLRWDQWVATCGLWIVLVGCLGWQPLGVVPGHALRAHGGLSDTTFFYRVLG